MDDDLDFYGFEAEEVVTVRCPSCGTEQDSQYSSMGGLGRLEHHRCRYCGTNFAVPKEAYHDDDSA